MLSECKSFVVIQLEGELVLTPGFVAPPNLDYIGYHKYIDEMLPPESPVLYGLHSNAEIEFLSVMSENLFRTLVEMQPRDSSIGEGSAQTTEEKVRFGQLQCTRIHNLSEYIAQLNCNSS